MFRVELPFVGERDPDPVCFQQAQDLFLVLEFRAGGVSERVSAAAVSLGEHFLHVAVVLAGEAEFGADAFMGVFRHGFGHLHGESVEVEVVLVPVFLEPDAGGVGGFLADGDDLQADDVAPSAVSVVVIDIAEEIGDALIVPVVLGRW